MCVFYSHSRTFMSPRKHRDGDDADAVTYVGLQCLHLLACWLDAFINSHNISLYACCCLLLFVVVVVCCCLLWLFIVVVVVVVVVVVSG